MTAKIMVLREVSGGGGDDSRRNDKNIDSFVLDIAQIKKANK